MRPEVHRASIAFSTERGLECVRELEAPAKFDPLTHQVCKTLMAGRIPIAPSHSIVLPTK